MSVRSVGIVLAAGASRRMGTAKAVLDFDGRSFLAHALAALDEGGVDARVVVAGPAPASVIAALPAGDDDVTVVQNLTPDRGQVSSLKVGLAHVSATWPDATLAVVTLVDHPAVRPSTVAALLGAARGPEAHAIVVPAYGGRRGHPVVFASTVWAELLAADDALGARVVVRADAGRVRIVEVDDGGILIDVDTPADLQDLRTTRRADGRLLGLRPAVKR